MRIADLRLRLESDVVRQVDSGIVHMLLDAVSMSQAEEQRRRPEDKLTLNKHWELWIYIYIFTVCWFILLYFLFMIHLQLLL